MIRYLLAFVFIASLLAFGCSSEKQSDQNSQMYGVGRWNADSLGNHRMVLRVEDDSDAVWAHIPWRRRDEDPQKKRIIITDVASGNRVENVFRGQINREFGDLIFQPQTVPGDYYVYYMPYRGSGRSNYPKITYLEPQNTAQNDWLSKHDLTSDQVSPQQLNSFPKAVVVQYQSINEFNSFYPMEIIATKAEVDSLLQAHAESKYLLFPEDRANPIRMTKDLPFKWIRDGIQHHFDGKADRGEFYAFQIGVFAVRTDIDDIQVEFSSLHDKNGKTIIADSLFTCFNTGGIDWTGKKMDKVCPVEKGKVQPLWMGVQVPQGVRAGNYSGTVTVAPSGLQPQTIDMNLEVTNHILTDAGDSEPWRHSRLRWLNSRIAMDDGIVPPYIPMKVDGNTVSCLGRTVTLDETGFPSQIQSYFFEEMTHLDDQARELLSGPIHFIVEEASGQIFKWHGTGVRFVKQAEGAVAWETENTASGFKMNCNAQMEFDGNIDFHITIFAERKMHVNDIRLEIPVLQQAAKYMMGMGVKGGYRPSDFQWKWDVQKNQDGVWIGDVNAGLQCRFWDENYSRPLNTNFYHSKPLNMPPSWFNNNRGGFRLREKDNQTVLLTSYSGQRTIQAGDEFHFNFSLLLTPFKPIDTKAQWTTRYYHRYEPVEKIAATGANTINVHHATEINPFINYPFLRPDEMKEYVDEAHRHNMKVKIYYTVRELSNRSPELFALRSLGDEILSYGPGGGFAWLQEHLDQNYIAGWFVPRLKDAAVINSGVSRWHNYYLEGLNWLVHNVGIDGLYIDDVAFDRTVMKRVRKILDRGREGALIDLHSANQFNVRDGYANSANLYMEHFPYINRLWFGEYFDYNESPDFWLTEVSGIPFGLMGEMLQDGGNPWRGMIYGMTSRLPWAGDPTPLWKLWDDFGMVDSRMIGYWVSSAPVKTDHKKVLATAYVKQNQTLVSIASWAKDKVQVILDVDWKALGLDSTKTTIYAPAVKDLQPETQFNIHEPILVEPAKGWLLILKQENTP